MPTQLEHNREMLEILTKKLGPDALPVKDIQEKIEALEYQEATGNKTLRETYLAYSKSASPEEDPMKEARDATEAFLMERGVPGAGGVYGVHYSQKQRQELDSSA